MSSLDLDRAIQAANAWVWVPEDARRLETARLLQVAFPAYVSDEPEVLLTHGPPPYDDVLAAACDQARAWGFSSMLWWVRLDADPGLEPLVLDAGGVREETLAVLAVSLSDGGPDLAASPGTEVRVMRDATTLRDGLALDAEVFDTGGVPDDETLERVLVGDLADLERGKAARVVAYLDGEPVGAGGVTVSDGTARLWGGGVIEGARRRGVYRAVLAARLAWAAEQGADVALTKGRVDSSAPILRRVGFLDVGEERSYRLRV